ncbi:MAG: hypothetical protein UT19_C0007G0010 [Candidatus Woesebacteria bacterium GW2011_GWB1_39_10b]|nr:MAG: hypothetical protein US72_C0007G0033 [Microgenomates group bacterium GW2011_GWC1_38_12]KKQ93766.1 MAG: hypothetical protein UT19_C0007G0010 [Candidatus Woesebacteria bacterium GW2011_GWB1_39_10b]KKR14329.1 MAG: hypothetical protein UT40_C0002G0008 [Candidatus Woesebacteria bacterium GW2011_GWA1_39_21b]
MTRTNNRAIFFGIILLGLALFFGKSETFALVGDLEFSPPELIINVSYSEPTDDHSITIYIDGKLKNSTVIQDLEQGKHTLKCVKAGFFDYEEEFNFSGKSSITCMMKKTTFLTVSINIPSGNPTDAKIYIDENFQGIFNMGSYQVTKGTHTVRCAKDGYEDFLEDIDVQKHYEITDAGAYYKVNCLLKPLPGTTEGVTYTPPSKPIETKPKGFWGGFLIWLLGLIKRVITS